MRSMHASDKRVIHQYGKYSFNEAKPLRSVLKLVIDWFIMKCGGERKNCTQTYLYFGGECHQSDVGPVLRNHYRVSIPCSYSATAVCRYFAGAVVRCPLEVKKGRCERQHRKFSSSESLGACVQSPKLQFKHYHLSILFLRITPPLCMNSVKPLLEGPSAFLNMPID
jgi:hypothetical protein